ncbi:hypothetical protein VNO80_02342 [Phaseolus coccineus]|uniref:PRORP domain-containing protein n=1 Tax=Phaseolus coccineus TaxID=3886 RepID=A0AAN9RMT7_PHACN
MWVSVAELEISEKFHGFLRIFLALAWVSGKQAKEDPVTDLEPNNMKNVVKDIPSKFDREIFFLRQPETRRKWLERHRPFDAVVDGANVGLSSGHNFSFLRLNTVVEQLRQMSPSKRLPLIILHISLVNGGPAQIPKNRRLIENWKKNGALYATPQDDEMRGHLFQLLGSSFFPRWKEKHQCHAD